MSCKVYLMCVRLIQNRMELFSTAEKLFVWQLRLRHKKHCHPIADTGYTKSKICFPLQIFGYCMRYWAFRWQRHSKTTVMSLSCSKQLRASFSRCLTQWKMYFCVPSLRPGMHHNYAVISGRHTSTDCVWLIILVTELCTTCRGERVLIVIRFNVTFLLLRPIAKKCAPVSCKKSKNVWVRALVQSECLYRYSSVFIEH